MSDLKTNFDITEHPTLSKINKFIIATSSFFKDEKNQYWISALVFFLMPILIFFFFLVFTDTRLTQLVPLSIDAQQWYNQVKSVLTYGHPLGHIGYNETHAPYGTFGPWGATMVFYVAALARVFGWYYWSPMLINAFRWVIANICFFYFVRPNKHQLFSLVILQLFLYVNIQYLYDAMSEMTRFTMAIFLAGLIYYLLYTNHKDTVAYKIIIYIITPIVLCTFTLAYALFGFCFCVYGYILIKQINIYKIKSKALKIIMILTVVILIPFVLVVFLYKLNLYTVAPYPANRPLKKFIATGDIVAFINGVWQVGWKNLISLSFSNIVKNNINSFFSSYKLLYNVFCILSILNIIFVKYKKYPLKDLELSILELFSLFVFLFGFCFLYNIGGSTYSRGVNVGLNFALYLYCVQVCSYGDNSQLKADNYSLFIKVIVCVSLLCLTPFLGFLQGNYLNNYKKNNHAERFLKRQKLYEQYIIPNKTADRWDNTVVYFWLKGTNIQKEAAELMLAALPAGIAYNEVNRSPTSVKKSKYVLARSVNSEKIKLKNYSVIYSDNDVVIYEKNKDN